jgi:hypothetical protein
MPYTTADGRRQMLDELAAAVEGIAAALASLGEAYERLDDQSAERLEDELFAPVQAAYGRAKRTHTDFAGRHGLPIRAFDQSPPTRLPSDARHSIERAIDDLQAADETLSTLQDSMLPVEVGDPELRAGLAQVRELISPLPHRSRELMRTLGR